MRIRKSTTVHFLFWFLLLPGVVAAADISSLLGMLTKSLGITQAQAEGGTAAIFETAKQNLSGDQFSQLAGAIPGLTGLLDKAPTVGGRSTGGLSSLAGQAGSLLGDSGGSLNSMAKLTDTFNSLGLSPDMVGKFTDVVMGFVKDQGGTDMMQMLQQALL